MALEVNNDNVEQVLGTKKVTLLQFSAEWCGPCKMLSPIISKLSEELQGKDVTIGKVNVDENPELGALYMVRNIPTVILFKDGKMVDEGRVVGLRTKDEYEAMIVKLLS